MAAHGYRAASISLILTLGGAVPPGGPTPSGREGGPLAQGAAYHEVGRYVLGGDGGWDYVSIDTVSNRVFIARQNRVMVVDLASGALLSEIPGLAGAHGVAFAYDQGHGFVTSGRDSSVTMFDLKTLRVLEKTTAGDDADALLYDPSSRRVFTFNGDAHTSSVIDASSGQNVGTVDLGGKPEAGVATGDGRIFVNIEDQGALAEIDGATLNVIRRWSLAPCKAPTGLAFDRQHLRLFSGCRGGKVMAISDAAVGRLIATVPIG